MSMTPLSQPIEKDCELFSALTRPALLTSFPRDSRAYVRIDASLRAYWHQIFDICPMLLDLTGPDGMAIYRPFMDFVERRELSLDWNFYLWIYEWLRQSEFRDRLSEEILLELMGAAAARWAVFDKGRNCGVAVGCRETPLLVVGWKCNKVDQGRQIELIEVEGLPQPNELFGCFFFADFTLSEFQGWQSLSK